MPPRRAFVGLLASWWPPLLVWLLATGVMLATAILEGWPPFAAQKTWARWDALQYLAIAKGGYTAYPCGAGWPAGLWCGNAGWFPAYPWIVGGLGRLGLPLFSTALVVSWLACLGTLALLWSALPVRRSRSAAVVGLLFAAFAPGVVYNYALFPLSLLTFSTLAFLILLQRDRRLGAGLAAAVAALAYPIGLVAAPVGVVWVLAHRRVPVRERLWRVVAVGGPAVAAVSIYILDQWLETGHWDAYVLIQQKYGHHAQDPLRSVEAAWRVVRHGSHFQLANAPALQTLLVTLVLGCVLVELIVRRGPTLRTDALVALWALAAWAVPLAETSSSAYRGEAALLPIALLVRRLPRPLGLALATVAGVLAVAMTKLYLRNILV